MWAQLIFAEKYLCEPWARMSVDVILDPPPIYTDADGHNIVQQCDIVGLRFAIHAAATKTIQLRARFSAAFVLIALKNTGVNNENGI